MQINLKLGDTQAIIAYANGRGVLRNQLAYILATAWWETAHTMKPVKEAYWIKNAEAWRKKNLRYWPWYGRGYVQLTWRTNYVAAGKKLKLDLTTDADAVMQPNIAAQILVRGSMEGWFTGHKITDYVTLSQSNFEDARRVINGRDKAGQIADIARDYDAALKATGYGEAHRPPVGPDVDPAPPHPAASGGLAALIAAFFAAIFGRKAK